MSDRLVFDVDAHTALESMESLALLLSSSGMAVWLSSTVGPYLKQRAGNRFANEGDDVSGKWAPLSQGTVNIRQTEGFGGEHPINVRTGEMENWVVQGGWHSYPNAVGASLQFPETTPSGRLAKKVRGAQQGEGKAPPRPVLGVNENDMLFVMSALAFSVDEAIS